MRLREIGYQVGMIDDEQMAKLQTKKEKIVELEKFMKNQKVKITDDIQKVFQANDIPVPQVTLSLEQLIKRPEISMEFLDQIVSIDYEEEIKKQVEINFKYEGYIQKTYKEVEKMLKLEKKQIPDDIDYDKIKNIASEARQKLKEVKPKTIAQAIRISGVNPADISILTIYLKKEYGKNE